MGRVDAIVVAGLLLWFNSSDHRPPHFHAKKMGHWEIRVFITGCRPGHLDFTVKWPRQAKGPNGRERKAILDAVLDAQDELLREWENKVILTEDI